MQMSYTAKLFKKLGAVPFSTRQAADAGITRHYLAKACAEGALERLGRGVYRLSGQDMSEEEVFRAACLRLGRPSCICLISALSYYGLTDLIARQCWVMVPAERRSVCADLRVVRSRNPRWKTGISEMDGFSISSLERSIVDALVMRSVVGTQVGIEALRRALRKRATSLSRVMEMARKLGVQHRVLPYVEALS